MLKQLMNLCRKTLQADSNSEEEDLIDIEINNYKKLYMENLIKDFEQWKIKRKEKYPLVYNLEEENNLLWKIFIYGDYFTIFPKKFQKHKKD